jgi:hypothetical protein
MAVVPWFDARVAWCSAEFLLSSDMAEQTVAHTRVLDGKHIIGVSYIPSLGVIPRWLLNFVPKRRQIKSRHWGIYQKNKYNFHNTEKALNQEK